jgi:hypothetical protein
MAADGNACQKCKKNHQKKINIKINIFGKKNQYFIDFQINKRWIEKSIKTIKININKKTAKFID